MQFRFVAVVFIAVLLFGCVGMQWLQGAVGFENFFAAMALPLGGETAFAGLEQGVVARVIDGDTLVLENNERVRLIGIDTPEKGQRCFEGAKNRLEQLVLGKRVLMVKDVSERDKYGRLVRFVYLDGFFVNLALVEEGFAHAFEFKPDTSLASLFHLAEAMASSEKKGCLWAQEGVE
jgi:micrococcal nuclease